VNVTASSNNSAQAQFSVDGGRVQDQPGYPFSVQKRKLNTND
jgi:hypothetical protein